jgi:hypothetical protein
MVFGEVFWSSLSPKAEQHEGSGLNQQPFLVVTFFERPSPFFCCTLQGRMI